MIKNTSITALIKLLDDTDEMVREHAEHTLLNCGEELIPKLIQLEQEAFDDVNRMNKISQLLKKARFHKTKNGLEDWLQSAEKNLLEGLYILTTYQFPELTIEEFIHRFQALNHRCWQRLHLRQTSFEKIKQLNAIFFDEFSFNRVKRAPLSPFELFVNEVLDTREGTDFSLGLIYSIVAQSNGLPVYGVSTMNGRAPFVLAYLDTNHLLPVLNWGIHNNGVLFYISMQNDGMIVEPQRLQSLYKNEGLPQNRAQFEPTANTLLLKRYLSDIKRSYANHPQFRYKLADVDELLTLFNEQEVA